MWRTSAYQEASISAVKGGETIAAASAAPQAGSAALHAARGTASGSTKKPVIITGSDTSAFAWIMKCRSASTAIP